MLRCQMFCQIQKKQIVPWDEVLRKVGLAPTGVKVVVRNQYEGYAEGELQGIKGLPEGDTCSFNHCGLIPAACCATMSA